MSAPEFDLGKAHRYFAVELNNLAWILLEKVNRSRDEDDRLLDAAHGACYHWLQVGAPINHARAFYLLSNVHAERGDAKGALRYAKRALQILAEHPSEAADFDHAFAFEACARANAAGGDLDEARRVKELARAAGRQIADAEERKIFETSFASRDWFGV